jgi:chromosome segregation ATPase
LCRQLTKGHHNTSVQAKTKMKAAIDEGMMTESNAEQKLWKERGLLEERIMKKERMIHNAQERLMRASWLWKEDRHKLENDVSKIRGEVDQIRERITAVDEEIREGEESEWKEALLEEEEASRMESVAQAAKELSSALGEARRKASEWAQKVIELEAKLKEVGGGI